MPHTPTVREGIFLGLFVALQFFWLFSAFAYSDTERSSERTNRETETRPGETRDASMSNTPGTPDIPRIPDIQFPNVGGTLDPAISIRPNSPPNAPSSPFTIPGTTSDLSRLDDLGSRIKYCIVFPFLNSAGPPIPTFDVPPCPTDPTPPPPPPPPGSPRLTVVKIVINDDAGFATTTDFTLLVGSTTVASGVERSYLAGVYVVSEATTTVIVGTTTMQYVQEFSGDCNAAGSVTLTAGDVKTCSILNDDEGPGGQGGDSGGGDTGGGNGGNGGSGNPSGPGSSSGGSGGSGGSSSGGSSPPGQVRGTTVPEFVGGADGEPGAPNAGAGGLASENIGLLLFSFMSALLGSLYIWMALVGNRKRV